MNSSSSIFIKEQSSDWVQNLFGPTKTTELKFEDFRAISTIDPSDLYRILDSESLVIKINEDVKPETKTRLLRIIAGKLDQARFARSKSWNSYGW